MEQLTFGTCVKRSWISTWQAFVEMPGLVLGVFVVITCTSLLSASFHPAPSGADFDPATAAGHAFARLALSILQIVVCGCLTIKVTRFVLLGEGTQPLVPLGGKPLGRHLLFTLGVGVGTVVITIAAAMLAHGAQSEKLALIVVPVLLVYLFILVRLSLIYPAVALGSRLTLHTAWQDSRGHFWTIAGMGFIAYLPLLVIWIAALLVGGRTLLAALLQGSVVANVVQAFVSTIFLVLSAAVMAWVYRRYANGLLENAAL
ncbi:lysylphosphatidylglycerol synthetase-like protein (DUF2156 family) [Paraburkholderia sp. GAS41]|jgi:hypothetical protein|uniref:hypothetical protein n=1 Tax=Paraburkholderia sp. GAS41 TaxID=3035134 RepID=UPI003D1AA1CF